jgi:hypothetical protein
MRRSTTFWYFVLVSSYKNVTKIRKGYIFISPPKAEGGRAAEAFHSLCSHIDEKIRDGYGEDGGKEGGRY